MQIRMMHSKTIMTLTIAVVVLLFASGPIVGNQQALVAGSGLVDTGGYGMSGHTHHHTTNSTLFHTHHHTHH
jgi:hypothetical protein